MKKTTATCVTQVLVIISVMQMPVVLLPNFLQLKCFLTQFANKLWLLVCVFVIKVLLVMCFLIKTFVALGANVFLFNTCTCNFMLLDLYEISECLITNLTLENIIIIFIGFCVFVSHLGVL